MSETANNGTATIDKVVTLPTQLEVEVAGATIIAPAAPTKSSGIKYEALFEADVTGDSRSYEEILGGLNPTFNGAAIPLSSKHVDPATGVRVVRISEPQLVNGKVKPGTGGKPTISFWQMLPDLGERGYGLRLTAKGIDKSGGKRVVQVEVQAIQRPQARQFQPKGTVVGELKL